MLVKKLLIGGAIAITAVAGISGPASARQGRGADDPVAHVRHGRGNDDLVTRLHHQRGADDPANHG